MRASLLLLHSLLLLLLLLLLMLLLLLLLHHHVRYLMLILLPWLSLLLRRLAIGHFSTRFHWYFQGLDGSQSESRNRERTTFHDLKFSIRKVSSDCILARIHSFKPAIVRFFGSNLSLEILSSHASESSVKSRSSNEKVELPLFATSHKSHIPGNDRYCYK